jgi:hypothetical protein
MMRAVFLPSFCDEMQHLAYLDEADLKGAGFSLAIYGRT